MKSFYKYLGFFLVFTVILTSCETTKIVQEKEAEVEPKIISNDYKMISIKEKLDYLITDISYPEFTSYPQLNKIIKNSVENNWNGFKSFTENEWKELNELNKKNNGNSVPAYEFKVTSEITYSKNYVSVLINTYNYNGGAHGNTTLITYNYNLDTDRIDNIVTATGLTYKELSEICRSKLYEKLVDNNKTLITSTEISDMKEMINTGAFPQPGNYEIFTLNKNKLYVYFEPYSVAPYAYGIQKIEIKLE